MAANVFQKSECGECQAMSAGWWGITSTNKHVSNQKYDFARQNFEVRPRQCQDNINILSAICMCVGTISRDGWFSKKWLMKWECLHFWLEYSHRMFQIFLKFYLIDKVQPRWDIS